ncbi:hypothetical protein [Aeropyrum globular virus 1]|uniref:hypothetical protein n=1 Tax=Aeropyrum globular virus 1 TaxID=1932713 RepID=UPI000C7EA74C|nr:hypothetical protein C1186_gp31 [Aeropyrum globular virus 1]BBC20954.1 hypothetical protein [Aeropyrum globular virus 1]
MTYEVTKDRVDYTWVLTQQVERIARLATEYWRTPRARQEYKLAELRGAVLVLLDLADPVVKGGVDGLYQELARARSYHEVMAVYRRVARMLQQAGLLVKRQRLEEEW